MNDIDDAAGTIQLAKPRRENFTQIDNAIMNDARLSVNARFLYAQLYQFAWNINSRGVFPGQRLLAERMRVKQRGLRNFMDELKDAGLVDVVRRGLNRTNNYIIHEKIRDGFIGLPPFDIDEMKFTRKQREVEV